jgi:hypothetical protein
MKYVIGCGLSPIMSFAYKKVSVFEEGEFEIYIAKLAS